MASSFFQPNQIWQDDCYYLNKETGQCERKYFLVLATSPGGSDALTAVFTTKPHGLTDNPACSTNFPRAGYYVGTPGGKLSQESWVEFGSIKIVDEFVVQKTISTKRTTLLDQSLAVPLFCAVLRCALQVQLDISIRGTRWLRDAVALLNCP